MGSNSERLFIVDDDPDIRAMIELMASSIGLAAESFAEPSQFLKEFSHSGPGCVVSDVMMPRMTGLQLMTAARDASIHLPFIILTGHSDVPIAVSAFRAGAFDFIEKPFSKNMFVEIVQRAIQHSCETMDIAAKRDDVERKVASLTLRERQVAEQMIDGGSNKVIARKLQLSHRTVERHRQNVLKKLSLRSVLELGSYLGALDQPSEKSASDGLRPIAIDRAL